MPEQRTTRLAPSPTGALHLGNARTFLINWALARQNGWRIVLRMEDLDGPRIKAGADLQAIADLHWLGLDWDAGPVYQRADLTPYATALAALGRKRLIYPCACTRGQIERALSAPHGDEHELRYPGTCRPEGRCVTFDAKISSAWRVIVPDEEIIFVDQIHGRQSINVQQQVGDFLVATKSGVPAYQLAVVVDDARQGVTDVVRGDDLLSSTARQILLYRVLESAPLPRYWHLPLVVGPDGRRLAKRHGDTRLAWYRERGVAPQRIVGLLARWSGIIPENAPLDSREFCRRFAAAQLPRAVTIFTPEDQAWLMGK